MLMSVRVSLWMRLRDKCECRKYREDEDSSKSDAVYEISLSYAAWPESFKFPLNLGEHENIDRL